MSQTGQQFDLLNGVDLPQPPSPPASRLTIPPSQTAVLQRAEIIYQNDYITEEQESSLLEIIDSQPWQTSLKRRVQHYGYRYDYTARTLSDNDRIGPLPDWISSLTSQLVADGIFPTPPDQLIINEYQPGQGIAPHIDRDCFGAVVAAISLGSDCLLQIYPPDAPKEDIVVLQRSMMAYTGIGRSHYRHGIAPRKTDQQNGVKIARARRVSLTFRTIVH